MSSSTYRPLVLAILDGWGLSSKLQDNAIALGETPNLDAFYSRYPWCSLEASGKAVGLLPGQIGDSNVGHLNLGAGRIVYQWLGFLAEQVASGGFATNPVISASMAAAREGTWHLLGLLSDGGVHSHLDHLKELLRLAKEAGVTKVAVHAFLDGRDVPPRSAAQYLDEIEATMAELQVGRIASISGRYYAMDRDNRWERIAQAWQALRYGEGFKAGSAREALEEAYRRGENDEFVQPTLIASATEPYLPISDGDSLFLFNFRTDRTRQLCHAFLDAECDRFTRGPKPQIAFATMTEVEPGLPAPFAFAMPKLQNTLGEVLAQQQLTQLRLAETEKYAHVTFFFDGGVEKELPGCTKLLIPSPKVATYDLQPEMSAPLIAAALTEQLSIQKPDVAIVNFANGDMVGHTGVWEAAVQATAAVDKIIGAIAEQVLALDGWLLITSDHGNCELMRQPDGTPHTAHTTNEVPFLLLSGDSKLRLRNRGRLADVAPTILQLLGLEQPEEMSGTSLILGTHERANLS